MGSEVLEEMEFQPMFDECKNRLGGKAVALFGSYGWGDGQWMRDWEKDCGNAGVNLVCDSVICCEGRTTRPWMPCAPWARPWHLERFASSAPPSAAPRGQTLLPLLVRWPPQRWYTETKAPSGQTA